MLELHAVPPVPSCVHGLTSPIGHVEPQVPDGHITSHLHEFEQSTPPHAFVVPQWTSHGLLPHITPAHEPLVVHVTMHVPALSQSIASHAFAPVHVIAQDRALWQAMLLHAFGLEHSTVQS